jgi:hypothetical protein
MDVRNRQQATDQSLSKPFPLGAGHDKFGLGFQIASSDPKYAKFRSVGSMSWAGIYNTEFWIDPKRHIGVVMMMQVLPFYDGVPFKRCATSRSWCTKSAIAKACGPRPRESPRIQSRCQARKSLPASLFPVLIRSARNLDYFRIVGYSETIVGRYLDELSAIRRSDFATACSVGGTHLLAEARIDELSARNRKVPRKGNEEGESYYGAIIGMMIRETTSAGSKRQLWYFYG